MQVSLFSPSSSFGSFFREMFMLPLTPFSSHPHPTFRWGSGGEFFCLFHFASVFSFFFFGFLLAARPDSLLMSQCTCLCTYDAGSGGWKSVHFLSIFLLSFFFCLAKSCRCRRHPHVRWFWTNFRLNSGMR